MTPKSRGLVDIGIGRLPVRTSEEAKAVVDKIISYMTDCKLGIWKNSLFFWQTMVMVVMVFLLYMFLMPMMLHPLFIKQARIYCE